MLDHHIASGLPLTVAGIRQPKSLADQFGVIETDPSDRGRIKAFVEKPKERKIHFIGVEVLAVHLLGLPHQLGKGQVQQSFDLLHFPAARAGRGGRLGGAGHEAIVYPSAYNTSYKQSTCLHIDKYMCAGA